MILQARQQGVSKEGTLSRGIIGAPNLNCVLCYSLGKQQAFEEAHYGAL